MRIMLVSHRYLPDGVAGIERITQSLAADLVRLGEDVSILSRRPGPSNAAQRMMRERLPDGTRLYRLVGGDVALDRFLNHHEELERLFTSALVEAAPDVVHVLHLIGLPPRLIEIAERNGTAVVLSLQDFYFACPLAHLQKVSGELCSGPDGGRECASTCFADGRPETYTRWGIRTAYFRRLLSLADRIICPSYYVASYFDALAGDGDRIRVVPNGVPAQVMEPPPAEESEPKEPGTLSIAFLGAVVAHKGAHVILEALELAHIPSAELLLLGFAPDPSYARSLRKRAEPIPGVKLRLYGAYRQEELRYLLDGVDCVVTPSQVPETFSITTREALARGIPALVSRLGALPEAISDGENGLLFAHDRPAELAATLRGLAFDRELLEGLRAGARKTRIMPAVEHAEAVRNVYAEAIDEVLAGRAPSAGDLAELQFLYDTLLELGFARAEAADRTLRRVAS